MKLSLIAGLLFATNYGLLINSTTGGIFAMVTILQAAIVWMFR